MTPELLWKLGRITPIGLSKDHKTVAYKVSTPVMAENKSATKSFTMPITGGEPRELISLTDFNPEHLISPDGTKSIVLKDVKINKVFAKDFYPELTQSTAQVYESLNYRHWDEWEDGSFGHLFVKSTTGTDEKDIMAGQPFDCPLKPSGGSEDYLWSPDNKTIVYVAKPKSGTAYALSTNTDLFAYDLVTGTTTNLTENMPGYDTHPSFSSQGNLAWLSMKRDGYEADKNDIIVRIGNVTSNLTQSWDGTVNGFLWSNDGSKIYFNAPIGGAIHLFEVQISKPNVKQITKGDFDVTSLVGQDGNTMVVTRTDMNHATEIYSINLSSGQMAQLTHVNDENYKSISLSKVESRWVNTTDNKKMLVYVIYPPDFDASKKYPTLLYCQGGPQSALTQFYSFRWNLQLMAANGYIVVAPNRRGMPGHGVAWNEEISKDHGGQAIQDYLSAIDDVAKESFVDKSRLGCVGASYGGYSVFYLAGIHNKRFKTFIAHDGIFDLKSMYGTTEELFFVNWDLGGAYWDKSNVVAQKTYNTFDPINLVDKWDTPILIFHGGKDYRVPLGQGLEAFQAAQVKGLKSKLIYFPDENHWILHAQNGLMWQREFFKWLKETL
jgi:dipeptidyl aminopeptidase/acylaminoacyl peptidase